MTCQKVVKVINIYKQQAFETKKWLDCEADIIP